MLRASGNGVYRRYSNLKPPPNQWILRNLPVSTLESSQLYRPQMVLPPSSPRVGLQAKSRAASVDQPESCQSTVEPATEARLARLWMSRLARLRLNWARLASRASISREKRIHKMPGFGGKLPATTASAAGAEGAQLSQPNPQQSQRSLAPAREAPAPASPRVRAARSAVRACWPRGRPTQWGKYIFCIFGPPARPAAIERCRPTQAPGPQHRDRDSESTAPVRCTARLPVHPGTASLPPGPHWHPPRRTGLLRLRSGPTRESTALPAALVAGRMSPGHWAPAVRHRDVKG